MDDWKPSDVELAASWLDYMRSTHKGCGHPIEEAFADESNPRNIRKRTHKYVADVVVCHACAVEDAKRDELAESGRDLHGVHVTSHRESLRRPE